MSPALTTAAACQVLDAAPVAMLLVSATGRIAHANPTAMRLFLLAPEEIGSLAVEALVPESVRGRHEDLRASFLEQPHRRVMGEGLELSGVRRDGTRFPIEVGLAPATVDGATHVICSITDLTARRALEEARTAARVHDLEVQRLESLALLAGGVAHDFNNLLVAVLGNARLAQSTDLPPLADECLVDITAAAEQASELSRQLLAYSGRGRFAPEPVDLSAVVSDARGLLRSLVRNQIDVRVHCADQLPMVLADTSQIRQILLNLVGNASDATDHENGTVHIGTSVVVTDEDYMARLEPADAAPGTYVAIDVTDNGRGIPSEDLPTIFEPFVSTMGRGRGMGLAAVRGIVTGHGGAIAVYSELGRGTTIKVLLPAVEVRQPESEDEGEVPSAPRHTILVVDDNEMVRKFARRTLEADGYQVVLAEDGQDGVERYAAAPTTIDLVLVDLTMPKLDGSATFRQLRQIDPDVRVVLTSGFTEHEMPAGLTARGLAAFLQKPFTPDQLRETIAKVLRA